MGTLWKELVWVASPTKYGGVHIQYVDYWNLLCPLPMAVGMLSLRYLLQSTLTDAMKIVPDFPAYYTFNGLLLLLLALHCFWTYLILKVVAKVLGEGQVEGDVRSSSDDSSEDN
jgi:hypothetical protein